MRPFTLLWIAIVLSILSFSFLAAYKFKAQLLYLFCGIVRWIWKHDPLVDKLRQYQ